MSDKDEKELIDYFKALVVDDKLDQTPPEKFSQNPDFLELDKTIKSLRNPDRKLKEGRAQLESLFQLIPDPVIITTFAEGRLVAYNNAFASFFQKREEKILDQGASISELYFEIDKRDLLIEELNTNGFCENMEMEIVADDQKDEPFLCLVSCRLFNVEEEPYILCMIRDTSEIRRLKEEISRISITDKLTQLYNRPKIDEILEIEMDRSERTKRPFAVMLFNIDLLKMVNETYGNQSGDAVLVECANMIKENVRSTDSVGRWNGEEFLILLPETDKNRARLLAEKLRARIDDYSFTKVGKMTASFGISAYKKDLLPASIVARADAALRKAKEKGRNQIEIC